MDYYQLPRDKRWLEPDSPGEIGGRATDVSQVGESLYRKVRAMFPINEVPEYLNRELALLQKQLDLSEAMIDSFVSLVSEEVNRV